MKAAHKRERWMAAVLQNTIVELLGHEDTVLQAFTTYNSVLTRFFEGPKGGSIFFFMTDGKLCVSASSAEAGEGCGHSVVQMTKTTTKKVNLKSDSDDAIAWAELKTVESALTAIRILPQPLRSDPTAPEFVAQLEKNISSKGRSIDLLIPDDFPMPIMPEVHSFCKAKKNTDKLNEVVNAWIDRITEYIADDESKKVKLPEEITGGPKTMIIYWERRLVEFTKTTEQLRLGPQRLIQALLSASADELDMTGMEDEGELSIQRHWAKANASLTDAKNEAKDNVRFLQRFEMCLGPMYNEGPDEMGKALPSVFNMIKMTVTLSRHFTHKTQIVNLVLRICTQLVKRCTGYIVESDGGGSLWERKPELVIKVIKECLALYETFKSSFEDFVTKLQSGGSTFTFDRLVIFEKFDRFSRRLHKLADVFSCSYQFNLLRSQHIDKLKGIVADYAELHKNFQKQKHDLLDYTDTGFERDYVQFTQRNSSLENRIQKFVSKTFTKVPWNNIVDALRLLKKFRYILHRDALQTELQNRSLALFRQYGKYLLEIRTIYNKNKDDPPMSRNMPRISRNIMWVRQLLRKICHPMDLFMDNKKVFFPRESRKIVKNYNRMAKILIQFETMYYNAWCESVNKMKRLLQNRLIVRHSLTGELFANFDRKLIKLAKEARALLNLGFKIPESARVVLLLERRLKRRFIKVQHLCDMYNETMKKTSPVIKNLLKPHIRYFNDKLYPGMNIVTWTSFWIDDYVKMLYQCILEIKILSDHINGYLVFRVRKHLATLSTTLFVDMGDLQIFTVPEFEKHQDAAIKRATKTIHVLITEIENAIGDLIQKVVEFPNQSEEIRTPEASWRRVRHYYQEMVFHALIKSVELSIKALNKRISSHEDKVLFLDAPLFRHELVLNIPNIAMSPSLDDVQNALTNVVRKIIGATKGFMSWGVEADGSTCERQSFHGEICSHPNIVTNVLILAGSISDTKEVVIEDLDRFKKFEWLWMQDPKSAYEEFISSGKRNFDDIVEYLQRIEVVEREIGDLLDAETITSFTISIEELKVQLRHECRTWKFQFASFLHEGVCEELGEQYDQFHELRRSIKREIKSFTSLKHVMDALHEVRAAECCVDLSFTDLELKYSLLDDFLPPSSYSKDENDMRQMLRATWRDLKAMARSIQGQVRKVQEPFRVELLENVVEFKADLIAFKEDYDANGPMPGGRTVPPVEAITRLGMYSRTFEGLERKFRLFQGGEHLFGMPLSEYPIITQLQTEIKLLKSLYDIYAAAIKNFDNFTNLKWTAVTQECEEMRSSTESITLRIRKLSKAVKKWEAFVELQKMVNDFQEMIPMIEDMSKPSIKLRHWQYFKDVTGSSKLDMAIKGDFDLLTLQHVIDANVLEFREDIEEICDGADQQLRIEKNLVEINDLWEIIEFEFAPFKARGNVILKGSVVFEVVEKLEDSQSNLAQMLTLRHVKPFRDQATEWLKNLSEANDVLESWLKLQQLWMSLEAVFTSGDIARQMPTVTRLFLKVDKEFVTRFVTKAREIKNVCACCTNEYIKNILPSLTADLEQCQKALDGYLENKRNKFPRFYFVSNPALLLILSQGSDRVAVQSCFGKVFDSISLVGFSGEKIVSFKNTSPGYEGKVDVEELMLSRPVPATGNIEDWLGKLLKEMMRTMHREIKTCASDVTEMTLEELVAKHAAQTSLIAIQFIWTNQVEAALKLCKTNKAALKEAQDAQNYILKTLSTMTTNDITRKMDRRKIETLVTIQVHQKDVLDELAAKLEKRQLRDEEDFEWQKQLRCYWKEEDNRMVVCIADVPFVYCWEYLGCKERLVVTPLTDRCYITLTQALGMYFGGAPAGPAGTGKTETVKDLGRALGKYVVVFNCSDQMRYTDTAKIYKGLCQSGSWGCFDEFNRIDLEVLSVVAQQISAILTSMRARNKSFYFPGDNQHEITLNPRCGFFITMNPGYAGRQELPENLKALFRSVAMMVPDAGIIIKVKLASVGYYNFEYLGRKFDTAYRLAKEQLSKQRHYDFGLRNILSVLRTMGAMLRQELKAGSTMSRQALEEMLLFRTLRDMNLSKLVGDDVGLFLSLLRDLFPGQTDPPKARYEDVEAALGKSIEKRQLIKHQGWMAKIIQLYETSLVRHGLMMIGPAGSGKTQALLCLLDALSVVKAKKYREVRLNPKAMRAQELFGENDQVSGEWTDGVFSSIWMKYNDATKNQMTWIVCDGPVDAVWIENLNTVLDDNKLLTLANGDRIPMTNNCKILFEAEDLRNASPATVSRAGIIYVDSSDLGYQPVMDAWMSSRRQAEKKALNSLYQKVFVEHDILDWSKKNTHKVFHAEPVHLLTNLTALLTALLAPSVEEQIVITHDHMTKIYLYCLTWTIGGLFERDDQLKFHGYLKSIFEDLMPPCDVDETIYEYYLNDTKWSLWEPPLWTFPAHFKFSECLIPTQDSTRAEYLLDLMSGKSSYPCLVLGSSGTGKSSTMFQYFNNCDEKMISKVVNFSSATTCKMFQDNIESNIEKRQGKTFGPPVGRKMTIFLDDLSMPEVNLWGDQPTLEIVRQLIEYNGFYFLEKDKRGDLKFVDGVFFVAAMSHPGGGLNDIPTRLKRHFFTFNLTPPSKTSIDNIYGAMLRGKFEQYPEIFEAIPMITMGTIDLWLAVKEKMLPTPAKFHYVFTMFDLARINQGILHPPDGVIEDLSTMIDLWKHECERMFCDKLVSLDDQAWYQEKFKSVMAERFGEVVAAEHTEEVFFVDFLRDDVIDPETEEIAELAPKVYERGPPFEELKKIVEGWLGKYNAEPKLKEMPLVMFTDAVKHCLRISRILSLPRGNALLVGVGGSGRQSLTRLATYMARGEAFQISLTRNYKVTDLLEDIKTMCTKAGKEGKKVAWICTDSEIIHEEFLEYINAMLATGMISGLFPKDEWDIMAAEVRKAAKAEIPGFVDSIENLRKYLANRIRDNFHICLAFSPANPKFAERARKFPALISGTFIDWFLRWPEDALVAVSGQFINTKDMVDEATGKQVSVLEHISSAVRSNVIGHLANVHDIVVTATEEYFRIYRRHVYVTPKSYLSFIKSYKQMYSKLRKDINDQSRDVVLGLDKIAKASKDVETMKGVLAKQKVELVAAKKKAEEVMKTLAVGAKEASEEKEKAGVIETSANKVASVIKKERAEANAELQAALPFMTKAVKAAKSIKKSDISIISSLPKPPNLIKRIMDCVLVLFYKPLVKVDAFDILVAKKPEVFIKDSYKESSLPFMNSQSFLPDLLGFAQDRKDLINEETMELLTPYLNVADFQADMAKKVSGAAEGLCKFVRAMFDYHNASLVVGPRLKQLEIKEIELNAAQEKLRVAQESSAKAQEKLDALQDQYNATMAEKNRLQHTAKLTAEKMTAATGLIMSLSGEQRRWKEDCATFETQIVRLVGDCALTCAFVSYCGPFNQSFRKKLTEQYFFEDCLNRSIPCTSKLNFNEFLTTPAKVAEWNSQGLPKDDLSVQNGILTTEATRWPLIIDPQGQAVSWLKLRCAKDFPVWGTTSISNPKLRDQLEFAMGEGKTLLCEGVENELEPMLDPILEKNTIKKGRSLYIMFGDQAFSLSNDFRMYFITKLQNPHFSPELSAKTTIIDFAVTQKGLEEQLLSRVINVEQHQLEEQRQKLVVEVNANTISLIELDKLLLKKLSESKGDLLEDVELIRVLANTKEKSKEVKLKIESSKATEDNINKKREQYRPVATRGSSLYFTIVDMALVNWMYQTSLKQFLKWFDNSLVTSEKANLVKTRVARIINHLTFHVYDNVDRGLFGRDKMTFKLMVAIRICVTNGVLTNSVVETFLKAGMILSIKDCPRKPFEWLQDSAWRNICAVSDIGFYRDLPDIIKNNPTRWENWYNLEAPEGAEIPELEERISSSPCPGFYRLLLVRALRDDRTLLAATTFLQNVLGERFVQPLVVTMDQIWGSVDADTPCILMLTPGADPTQILKDLARSKGLDVHIVSMGEGQEPYATKAILDGVETGGWALLQNCHLGLKYMATIPGKLADIKEEKGNAFESSFRLFITCEPHDKFPVGLLQQAIKVAQEAPQGIKAGLQRTYNVMVNLDRLERVDKKQWRDLLFVMSFLHSVVQERRKFGPIGWNIPYEFNESDLEACMIFLEKHMFSFNTISWPTVQYMICEAQYGGRITDDFDRTLFNTYGYSWLSTQSFGPEFAFAHIKGVFDYELPNATEIGEFRDYVATLPINDSPEIFGLHTNADLTFGTSTALGVLNTILDTQPKESAGSGGLTREEQVKEKCKELLNQMPEDFVEAKFRDQVKKRPKNEMEQVLGRKDVKGVDGFSIPLNVFLYQEIVRLQGINQIVRETLKGVILAIDGVVIMTPQLQLALDSIFAAKPPAFWFIDASGAQIAWTLPSLALWFQGLLLRNQQLTQWLTKGRPNVYWMTGFFNPQGFLTAMRQEVTRKHKAERWSLDDIVFHSEIMDDGRKIKHAAEEGVYIRGLFLDGCGWDSKAKSLTESKPKELFVPLPIVHVTAYTSAKEASFQANAKHPTYACPVYTVPRRTDLNFVFVMDIPTKKPATHWVLRGVAVLCSKD